VAVEVSCDVQGIREFQTAMQTFQSGMQNYVHAKLVSWAADVKAEAMRRAPVKTGHLRSTIYATVKDWVVNLGAEATYALFVEVGTRYIMARPYLWPSIQAYLPQLQEIIKEAIDAAKAEAGFR
jgi:HK97 gp10 family phage protein